jgi:hypothetical protein
LCIRATNDPAMPVNEGTYIILPTKITVEGHRVVYRVS